MKRFMLIAAVMVLILSSLLFACILHDVNSPETTKELQQELDDIMRQQQEELEAFLKEDAESSKEETDELPYPDTAADAETEILLSGGWLPEGRQHSLTQKGKVRQLSEVNRYEKNLYQVNSGYHAVADGGFCGSHVFLCVDGAVQQSGSGGNPDHDRRRQHHVGGGRFAERSGWSGLPLSGYV